MAQIEERPELPQYDPVAEAQKAQHRRLRGFLILAVVVLVVAAASVGVMVWRNSVAPEMTAPDAEVMGRIDSGVDTTEFDPIKIKGMPALTKLYGKTVAQAKALKGSNLTFSPGLRSAEDASLASGALNKKARYKAVAFLAMGEDKQPVDVSFYLNKKKKIIDIQCDFDLDELGVAEADFSVLTGSSTVPASLLSAVGISKKQIESADLTQAAAGEDSFIESDNYRCCVFRGKTGAKPKTVVKTKKVKAKKAKHGKSKKKFVKKKVKVKMQVSFEDWIVYEAYSYGSQGTSTTRSVTIELY